MATYGFDENKNKIEVPPKTETGTLSSLRTTDKSSLVAAVNECFQNASDGKSKLAAAIGNGATASMTWDQLAGKVIKVRIDRPTTASIDSTGRMHIYVQKAFQTIVAAVGTCKATGGTNDAFIINIPGTSIKGGDSGSFNIPSGNGNITFTANDRLSEFISSTIVQIGYD